MVIRHRQSAGFTLVEIVVTIVISAIIAVGVLTYISDAVTGFATSSNRNALSSSGRSVVDRLAMELHNALPNSIRVTTALPGGDQCIEFIPFVAATNYLDAPFTGNGGDTVEAVDFHPQLIAESPAEMYAVIYPIDTQDIYTLGNPGPVALIDRIEDDDAGDGRVLLTLDETHQFAKRSPVDRLYVTRDAVSFCVVGTRLFRYENYGIEPQQCTPAANSCDVNSALPNRALPATLPDRTLISEQINNSGLTAFSILEPTLRRNAIISIELNFSSKGDVVRLKHEVQQRNVP